MALKPPVKNKPGSQIGPTVPLGRVAVNDKWFGTPLGVELTNNKTAFFAKDLGLVDFYVTNRRPLVYIPQAELMVGEGDVGRRKLEKLIAAHSVTSVVVITERNLTTITAYNAFIEFASLELGLYVLPVGNQMEIPHLLKAWANEVAKPHSSNPFLKKVKPNLPELQSTMLGMIPGINDKKVRALLENFSSVGGIANATVERMELCVGSATARNVWKFFHEKISLHK